MKIRSDFVTNSSSVSYILTMKEELATSLRSWAVTGNPERAVVFDALKEFIRAGQTADLDGEKICFRKIKFDTGDGNYRENDEKVDYSKLSNDDLWAYIYGDYIINGELSKLLVFGITQIDSY